MERGYFKKGGEMNTYIYGAGGYGEWVCRILSQKGDRVAGFLDQNAEAINSLMGLPVRKAEDPTFPRKDSTVIVALVQPYKERERIFAFIRECGFEKIVDAQSIRCHYVPYSSDPDLDDMWGGMDLFTDDHSIYIYSKHAVAHIDRDYEDCVESIGSVQYFPKDVPFSKGYERFVDCGAYTGDTVAEAIRLKRTKAVVMFEPMNFGKIMKSTNLSEMYLFPCAVSEKTEMISMAEEGGSSHIGGNTKVQAVALDDVMPTFAPTFIKMDIEGAEMKALRGAWMLISRYRPDLAISVYHCVNHLWDVPLLINSWGLGYKFWLKCHNSFTMETVLYATT
jgi:FkbM family methyltransferase